MPEENRVDIVKELKSQSRGKGIVRFISTHPDDDHILGLAYLNEEMPIINFYCVKNEATKTDLTNDFEEYCALRDDLRKAFYLHQRCFRKWMNETNEERGSSGITILWPIIENEHYKDALENAKEGESPNNISPIVKYSLEDSAKILWMGDLETEFMERILDELEVDSADVLFAPHHGRDSGKVPGEWLERINPKIIIIGEAPSENLNYYDGYNTITQNSAGQIVLECVSGKIHIFVSSPSYFVDFLDDEHKDSTYGNYIGTLNLM